MAVGDEILAMMQACAEQVPRRITECPVCDWPLEELTDGSVHCKFCGWTDILGRAND